MPTFTRESLVGIITIFTKAKLPNNINAIDQDTWDEIGKLVKELIKKMEEADACHDFQLEFLIGKEAVKIFKEESELPSDHPYPESEFIGILFPRYKLTRMWDGSRPAKNNKAVGTMENDRLAEKLNDPEEYAKIWGKTKELEQTENNSSRISPMWLIPTVLVTMTVTALTVFLVLKKKKC